MKEPKATSDIRSNFFRSFPRLISWLVVALSLAACGGTATTSSPTPPPEAVRKQLESIVTSAVGSDDPGATIQITAPDWTWTWAAGNAQIMPPIPAQSNMYFRIASVSKTFTAIAIMKLAEEGKLNLDDPIEKWLPATYLQRMSSFPYHQITLRLLLNHRSAIHDYDESGVLIPLQMSQPTVPVTTDFAIFYGLDRGPEPYPPGGGFDYSNVNYLLLARVVDVASGMSYENYIRRIIIERLGLLHTIMSTDPLTSALPDPYMRCLLNVNQQWFDLSTMYLLWDRGAGDIVSTVEDLNIFHKGLRDGKIINVDSLREMQRFLPATTLGESTSYGLGYMQILVPGTNATVQGHAGGYPGSHTHVFYLVDKKTYIALNVNGLTSVPLFNAVVTYLMQVL